MVGQALRDVLQRGTGAGDLPVPGARTGTGEHPACGDLVQLAVLVDDGRITALRWRAAGCPASMAVAALAAEVLPGASVAGAADRLRAAIAAHGGLAPQERHAEAVVLRALRAATGG